MASKAEIAERDEHAMSDGFIFRNGSGMPDIRIAVLAAGAFFLLQLFLVQYHEMWRDELQAWLLARDSADVLELMQNLRYEGHPGLWHLLLMPLTRLAPSPFAMQVFHVAIASATVFVLVRHAPFRWPILLLVCLGYFVFYEYAQLARNYAIGALLTFILCALFPVRDKFPVWIAVVLFLLCHTSVFGIIIALAFSLAVVANRLVSLGPRTALMGLRPKHILAGIIVWAGLNTAIMQIIPPRDFGFDTSWNFTPDGEAFSDITKALTGALLPLPPLDLNFWGELQVLSWGLPGVLITAVLAAILLSVVILLRRSPFALFFLALSAGGLLVFFYAKFSGHPRHHGFLFIALIASLWLAPASFVADVNRPGKWTAMADRLGSVGVLFVLLVQAAAGLMAAAQDYRYTFSNARKTAEFIRSHDLDRGLIAGLNDTTASAVAGFLAAPFYYPVSGRYGTFVRWDDKRRSVQFDEMLVMSAKASDMNEFHVVTSSPLYQNTNSILVETAGGAFLVTGLFEAEGAVLRDENFYVYSVTRK